MRAITAKLGLRLPGHPGSCHATHPRPTSFTAPPVPGCDVTSFGKVVEEYERQGMVARVNGNQDIQAVFRDVLSGLRAVQEKEVLDATRAAVEAVSTGDWSAYAEVCSVVVLNPEGTIFVFAGGARYNSSPNIED